MPIQSRQIYVLYKYTCSVVNSYHITVYGKTFEGENFRGCAQNTPFTGKLSRCIRPMPLCTQIIQGENFRDWLKNRENRESFAVYGIRSYSYKARTSMLLVF